MRNINNLHWNGAVVSKTSEYNDSDSFYHGVWYDGVWHDGRWFCSIQVWYGEWLTGSWLNGKWSFGIILDTIKSTGIINSYVSPKSHCKPKLTLSLNYAIYI